MPLKIESSAFAPGAEISIRYTGEGEDLSPPLTWSGLPQGTKSFALIVDDPDAPDPAAPRMVWVHWVLFNNSAVHDEPFGRRQNASSRNRRRVE